AFAVGETKGGQKTIVVRVRQSKQQPPELVWHKATAYKHYLKLPNLFLPVGTRLHPPLRRDQVRKLLAEDTGSVVWLHPGEKGSFTPESLPEDSFRPLWDWIDYVLDHEKEPLQAWVQAAQFDFEPFICAEDPSTKPRKPPSNEPKGKNPRERSGQRDQGADFTYAPTPEEQAPAGEAKSPLDDFGTVVKVEPSQLRKQLTALEESFRELEGGLDSPERQEMWPQLAALNTQLNNVDDAGACWMNALWERDEQAVRKWAWHWFQGEASAVPTRQDNSRSQPRSWASPPAASKSREMPG